MTRRPFTRRAVTSVAGAAVFASGLLAFAATPSYAAGPGYQMPFSCGQSWTGVTRAGHSPSPLAIDWTRREGTLNQPVTASADGTVSKAVTLSGSYGKYVVIDHGGGHTTLYAHLNDYDVTAGTRVTRGQKIGVVGSTGNSTGPHLHYEQRYNGQVKQSVFNGSPFSGGATLTSQNCAQEPPQPPAQPKEWRAQVAVQAGGGLYHALRNADRTWTDFGNVESAAGEVPSGARDIAEAGINGDTHLLAVGNDGKLYHSIRFDDRSWTDFGDVGAVAGALANVTQVSAASIGTELHVAVVADGTVHHTIRHADGTWDAFGSLGRPGGAPVAKVEIARTGDQLQVVALSDTGVLRHAIRHADRTWTAWGDASAAAGATAAGIARIDDVAVAGTGNGDLQLVVTANGGAQQFHGARYGSGTWTGFNSLAGIVPSTTVTDVAAAAIEGELQVAMVTADGRVLHTIRHTNATWSETGTVDLTGVPATRTGIAVTGTYS
ncbi:peptidoglycan DD-metalloendopeptidase family protein [Streptomyces antimicrobicus]|uniref:peptidoglycan DD-metalloendopeptidase family protein n=1 Tax=Streptomyces antimicrobicus TaxID=2883108 RepID=UPI0027E0B1E5|nr:peptidoglycan DD-metalloendopeptidase family protein [Streptomyces antimicrobicus]